MRLTPMRRPRFVAAALLLGLAAPVRAQDFPPEQPPGAIVRHVKRPPRPCELELSLVAKRSGAEVTLRARVKNRTRQPITFVVPDACAGGPVRWMGIRDTYDFYGRCNAGPCVTGPGQQRVTVRRGESRELSRVTISIPGNTCNQPVPPGQHPLAFTLPFLEGPPEVCGNPGWKLFVAAPPPPPEPKEWSQPPPPPRTRQPAKRCPAVACGVYCPYGYGRDANGCPDCSCLGNPLMPGEPTVTP